MSKKLIIFQPGYGLLQDMPFITGWQKKNTSIEIIGPIGYEENIAKKAIQKDELNRLRREISFLSERYREIIILHYFKNKSCIEIADLLSIPPGTVKWYLYDARKRLKWGMDTVENFARGLLILFEI